MNKSKSSFLATLVIYLGYNLDKEGLHPTHEKVEAIKRALSSENTTQLKACLGLLNYYSNFFSNLATVLNPLYFLLTSTKWRWGSREEAAFQDCKKLLLLSQVLVHYSLEQELILACNASDYGLELFCLTSFQMARRDQLATSPELSPLLRVNILRLKKKGLHVSLL